VCVSVFARPTPKGVASLLARSRNPPRKQRSNTHGRDSIGSAGRSRIVRGAGHVRMQRSQAGLRRQLGAERVGARRADAPRRQLDPEVRRRGPHLQRPPHQRPGFRLRQHAGVSTKGLACLRLRHFAGALQRRDVSLGIQHQQHRTELAGAHHRGQATHQHVDHVHEQPGQHAPAKSADHRSVAALGGPARHHGEQQLRERRAAGGRLHAALPGPHPRRRPPARRRGAVAVRRAPRRLVHAQLRPEGAVVLREHVQLPEQPGGDDAVVPRPRARHRSRQRLRGPGRLLLDPRQPRHGPRHQPDHLAVGRAGS